jgi:hypothetical protein
VAVGSRVMNPLFVRELVDYNSRGDSPYTVLLRHQLASSRLRQSTVLANLVVSPPAVAVVAIVRPIQN